MRYTTFGRTTGLRVSEYALGTGVFGTRWGAGAQPDEARKMFDVFAEAGGTFIDTADTYEFGESEEILGELLGSDRDRFTVATKFTLGVNPQAGVSRTGNSAKTMIRAVEGSLARMRTDYVDLLWVHFPDAVTPTDEIVRGLDNLVRAGKIRYAGLSNFPAWRVARAATLAELRGWSPIVGVQLEYSLAERSGDRELLPMAEALGLGVALWSPLGGGLLTGKYRASSEGRLTALGRVIRTEDTERRSAAVDAVLGVAAETGASPAQVAMAWLRSRAERATTAYVPIIGPRTVAQLEDYLGALSLRLDPDHERRLAEASAVPLGEPHEAAGNARAAALGGDADVFDTPIIPVA